MIIKSFPLYSFIFTFLFLSTFTSAQQVQTLSIDFYYLTNPPRFQDPEDCSTKWSDSECDTTLEHCSELINQRNEFGIGHYPELDLEIENCLTTYDCKCKLSIFPTY